MLVTGKDDGQLSNSGTKLLKDLKNPKFQTVRAERQAKPPNTHQND